MNASEYPTGARLTFADGTATVSDGLEGLTSGLVNGPPICDDDGIPLYVPAFCSRDHGREATTVYVAVPNIVAVER